jgi:hypothetical protein
VPSTWAAFEGWEAGNKVKLDCAGDVARRWGIGGGAGDFKKPYTSAWLVSYESPIDENPYICIRHAKIV